MKWAQEYQKFKVILGYIVVCYLKASLVYIRLHLRKHTNTSNGMGADEINLAKNTRQVKVEGSEAILKKPNVERL